MTAFTKIDLQQLTDARDDLLHLRTIAKIDAKSGDARRASVTLRKLLVDGTLIRDWKRMGFPKSPQILATRIGTAGLEEDVTTGAGMLGLGGIRWGFHPKISKLDTMLVMRTLKPTDHLFMLPDYIRSACAILGGHVITRHQLIKYVANKADGVHSDPKREKAYEAALDEADVMKVGGADDDTMKAISLTEIVSIAESLCISPDIFTLIHAIEKALGRNLSGKFRVIRPS
jgi:hypothetical protein